MANQQEYGLFQLIDRSILNPNELARTVDSGLLSSAILYDAAQHNADVAAFRALFVEDTTEYQTEVTQSASGRNQPLDENGRSLPVKPVAPYTVAFPLQGSGSAWGRNFLAGRTMTVRDLAKTTARMLQGDYNWVADHILAALFLADGYTHRDPRGRGNLNIEGLANGDATTYYRANTGTSGTDTHLFATASAIADGANPFSTMKNELLEHPDNGGEVIAFVPTNLKATTVALAEFNSATLDPDITLATSVDRLTGTLDGVTLPPFTSVLGKTDSGVWVVEWPRLPDGYIVAVATQGPRPLARRIDPDLGFSDFAPAGTREDYPYFEEQWMRWEGYGGFNRVGALVQRVGDGSYAVPDNYSSPMP